MEIWTGYFKLSDETGRDRFALDCGHSHLVASFQALRRSPPDALEKS
jgi:hypothetical protein